jgi:hypothetical protein
MTFKKTSKEWLGKIPKKYKVKILDPDGWDRKNFDYSFNRELITKKHFINRLFFSTIQCDSSFYRDWDKFLYKIIKED